MEIHRRKQIGSIFIFISAMIILFQLDYDAFLGEQNLLAAGYIVASFIMFLILYTREDGFSLENISFSFILAALLLMSVALALDTPPKELYQSIQGLFLLAATLLVFYNFQNTV